MSVSRQVSFCGTTEDVFPKMVEDSVPIYGYLYDGYWKDMGNRESYLQVNADALDCKVKLKGYLRINLTDLSSYRQSLSDATAVSQVTRK